MSLDSEIVTDRKDSEEKLYENMVSKKDYNSKEEMDLIQSAAQGSMESFEELYKKYYSKVYTLCLRMLNGNIHEAEDLTQIAFIQLYKKIDQFRGDSAFATWLHRLTVNQVLMYFRSKKYKYEHVTEDGIIPDVPNVSHKSYYNMPINDQLALEEAIDQLPKGYKNVFILHDVHGYEHEEVAKILRCSVGTSKSQLHKARLKLQKLLRKKANPRLRQSVLDGQRHSKKEEADFIFGVDISQTIFSGEMSLNEAFAMADLAFEIEEF